MPETQHNKTAVDKSIGELFSDLTQGVSSLVHQEVQLAKTEISEHISSSVKGIAFLIIAGCLAFVGFQALVAAAILGLSLVLAPWLAAFIVGLALLLIAGVLLPIATKSANKITKPPEKTIASLKEDAQWLKQQKK